MKYFVLAHFNDSFNELITFYKPCFRTKTLCIKQIRIIKKADYININNDFPNEWPNYIRRK